MRVVLVGREPDRDRLRPELVDAGFEIVAETATMAAARDARTGAAAFILARPETASPDTGDDVVPESLTTRELQVLALLAEGLPNKAIASRLDISDQTVKFHVAAILAQARRAEPHGRRPPRDATGACLRLTVIETHPGTDTRGHRGKRRESGVLGEELRTRVSPGFADKWSSPRPPVPPIPPLPPCIGSRV